ncbi:MAG: hypothetical protein GY788_27120 [bacterium]|nr:hypothetical protein [bacterium]
MIVTSLAMQRLLAYCRNAEAREALGLGPDGNCGCEGEGLFCAEACGEDRCSCAPNCKTWPCCCEVWDYKPTYDWLLGLRSLVEATPTRECGCVATLEAPGPGGMTMRIPAVVRYSLDPCPDCQDTGTITSPTFPMKRLSLACAWAAASEEHGFYLPCCWGEPPSSGCTVCFTLRALDAAQAHLDSPTADTLAAWWAAVTKECQHCKGKPIGTNPFNRTCPRCTAGRIRHLPLWVPTPDSDPVKDMEACGAMVDVKKTCKEGVQGWTE